MPTWDQMKYCDFSDYFEWTKQDSPLKYINFDKNTKFDKNSCESGASCESDDFVESDESSEIW